MAVGGVAEAMRLVAKGVQGGAQVMAKVGAKAGDGRDAGGGIGVETQGQQPFQPLLLP